MKTKKPVGLVYGWKKGMHTLTSDVYYWEGLQDNVTAYGFDDLNEFQSLYTQLKPDVVISLKGDLKSNMPSINKKIHVAEPNIPDPILANIIVCQSIFRNSEIIAPKFSIFTPTYKTGDRIYRTYEGLVNQTYKDWEWIIVDDSPTGDDTWDKLLEISNSDHRVKPYKITPNTGGIVGDAKRRACLLSTGEWLVELDHDDYLLSNCLEEIDKASIKFPDAGFMYSEVCELYDDGEMKYYTPIWGDEGYANPQNGFNAAFGIHYWTKYDGKDYLNHRYSDINPLSIRFNFSMPNHVRTWKRDLYLDIGGHNPKLPVADDYDLIVRTFLKTKMVHIKKMLYFQYNNKDSTVDNNVTDINRRARLIRDHYDKKIHDRILELGKVDWMWDEENNRSYLNFDDKKQYFEKEQVMNYIYL